MGILMIYWNAVWAGYTHPGSRAFGDHSPAEERGFARALNSQRRYPPRRGPQLRAII